MRSERGAVERLPRNLLRTASIVGSVLAPVCVFVPAAFAKEQRGEPSRVAAKQAGELLFASNRSGYYQIYEENLATGITVQLTHGKHDSLNPQPSPDGNKFVYYSDRDSTNPQIFLYDKTDVNVKHLDHSVNLTKDGASDYDPVFMPDGKRVLFKSNKDDGYGDIWIMNIDGSGRKNLTPGMPNTEEWKPEPIGNDKVIFTSRKPGKENSYTDELHILKLPAGALKPSKPLAGTRSNNVADWFTSYSNKSDKVAFVSKNNPKQPEAIFTMTTDGKDKKMISNPSWENDSADPSWSPDGKNIFFLRWSDPKNGYGIWEMDSRGGNPHLIDQGPSNSRDLSPISVPVPSNPNRCNRAIIALFQSVLQSKAG